MQPTPQPQKPSEPPLVTIGIPCFNAALWIAGAVQSALDQTWSRKEIVVIDDGSTDDSLAVLKEKFRDLIRIETGPNRGVNSARNTILRLARGEWIQYIDADDYLLPQKIETQFREAAPIENADVIYSPILLETWRDGAPQPLEIEPIDAALDVYAQCLAWQLPQTSGAIWRKTALEKIGGWDENRAQMCDEHDCYQRALKLGARFIFTPTPSAVYRIWSENTRCRGANARGVIASRTAVCESLRAWLRERGLWNEQHRRAMGRALLEMARTLAKDDLDSAEKYHAERRGDFHLAGPAAPWRYRLFYRALGFRRAEKLARVLR